MQLKSNKQLGKKLAAATCALLGVQAGLVEARDEPGTWDFDTAVLYYAESDDKVQAAEPVISATRNYENDQKLNLKLVVDTLTGASPNGATPSDSVQTFTRPSGSGSYETQSGEQPLDDTFIDTRVALSTQWSSPISRDWAYSTGVYGSVEHDYISTGINGNILRYLNNKNTTLNAGLALSHDIVTPEGGVPAPLGRMATPNTSNYEQDFSDSRDSSEETKDIIDMMFGATQVINRRMIMQFNYSISLSDGYLTDPYKLLSVIDDQAGANYGGNLTDADGNNVYLYENRPDSRMKHTLYWQTKYQLLSGDIIDGSYRLMVDDWGITSHTFDMTYRWQLGNNYLEPHLRYYMQSEADFYQRYITSTEYNSGVPTIQDASADYRLGELDTWTLGLKYGYRLDKDRELSVRLEYYQQTNTGDSGIGKLADQELYPDNDAIMVQLGYSF